MNKALALTGKILASAFIIAMASLSCLSFFGAIFAPRMLIEGLAMIWTEDV